MLNLRQSLLAGVATCAVVALAQPARAEVYTFDIPAQSARTAIPEFGRQSGIQILASQSDVGDLHIRALKGDYEPREALRRMLEGTNLQIISDDGRTVTLAQAPQSGSAASSGAEVEALIVTAQKREEDIQDVPIAISAFTQEDLTRSQVAGGPDLMTQVPNMTFTKTNFSSYSIQIRGIGTQAISATTDVAVAVAFNNTPFIRNRFFEQEFYDLARVEVLRGPQGTLYGRNATAGVVNIVSAPPTFGFESRISADVSNYSSTRLEGMVNVPLVEDKVALRVAGAWTKRDGYAVNELTGNPIDGRNLWSSRVSLRFEPTDTVRANFIWEHFEEDDDRLRSGKQLCKTHEITEVAGFAVGEFDGLANVGQGGMYPSVAFSQGCTPESLYSPESFRTPNGLSLPYYYPLSFIFLPAALANPYVRRTQSDDLRVIESTVDPEYRAKTDLAELQISFDLTDDLTLSSETGYLSDFIFSLQDYNRFNTVQGAWKQPEDIANWGVRENVLIHGPEGGIFCDPQIGCADRLVAVDLSTARSRQFSQEFRLASDYSGPFNFSLGANFLRYDTEDKYYVFINSLSLISAISPYGNFGRPLGPYDPSVTDNSQCLQHGMSPPDPSKVQSITYCTYMDPNPIGSLNDLGHNYFLSKNPYKLISYAVFGEGYYNITDNLKLTAGLRWTVDRKEAPRIPSWVLASDSVGYPALEVIEQEWSEPTGRLTLDWKPDLSFTDETLLYASFARGYKAGGANPPPTGVACYCADGDAVGAAEIQESATHPKTFDPEFVNAFEIGAKNTLLDGRLTLNASAFYYDYEGYQISQIVDRSAVNLNFDAEIWGVEIEADWRPLENLRLGFKGGFQNTRIADGMRAIDLMDRTAGNEDWIVVRPFPTYTSNCILPKWLMVGHGSETNGWPLQNMLVALGGVTGGNPGGCELAYSLGWDPVTQAPYVLNPAPSAAYNHEGVEYAAWNPDLSHYPGWPDGVPLGPIYPGWNPATAPNHGEGFFKDLSGNELPNAPHYTATITADYTIPLPEDWLATLHADLYYQSEAWTRVFNTEGYDKLKAYTNVNLAAIFTNEDAGWKVMAYVKNVFDRDSITGAFLNSDDTGLTTNVFLTEPRLYGLRVTKEWNGGPWWTGTGSNHTGPYPLTIEVGGQVQRLDAPYQSMAPSFAGEFSSALDTTAFVQNRDLDRGDGRSLKITYQTENGWSLSAAARYGRANTDTARVHVEEPGGEPMCLWEGDMGEPYCDPTGAYYSPIALKYGSNLSDASARSYEEHSVADFEVGRELGFGLGEAARSRLSLGVRFADLESTTAAAMMGLDDYMVPEGWLSVPSTLDRYWNTIDAEREFKGFGPTISWDAGKRLFGDLANGQVEVDWTVRTGLLFGKQKTAILGEEQFAYYAAAPNPARVGDVVTTPITQSRSTSATIPVVDLSLGLSYEIQRIKIGAGYRWERYFDVLDAGYTGHKDADRTIDGPYFKLSVGFGG